MKRFLVVTLILPLLVGSTAMASTPREGLVTVGYANVRSEPKSSASSNGKIYTYDVVTILSSTGDWYKIRTDSNTTGYIPKKYVATQWEEIFLPKGTALYTFQSSYVLSRQMFAKALAKSGDIVAIMIPGFSGTLFVQIDAANLDLPEQWDAFATTWPSYPCELGSMTTILAYPNKNAPALAARTGENVEMLGRTGDFLLVRFLKNTDETGGYSDGIGYIYAPE